VGSTGTFACELLSDDSIVSWLIRLLLFLAESSGGRS
jgi:hypothetical protein